MARELVVMMAACGTGLVTESSTIILVPGKKGARKGQLWCCMGTEVSCRDNIGAMLAVGFCVLLLCVAQVNLPGMVVFETRIWRWDLSIYAMNQGTGGGAHTGGSKCSQDVTL